MKKTRKARRTDNPTTCTPAIYTFDIIIHVHIDFFNVKNVVLDISSQNNFSPPDN